MTTLTSNHPYYPPDLHLAGSKYIENSLSVTSLITSFGGICTLVLGIVLITARRANSNLKTPDQALILWFVLSGSLHLFFEGYFVYNHSSMASQTDLFGQLWKEYALSDSRYLTSDPLVLCMESLTVLLWAPLSLLAALSIATISPYRHMLQSLVSTGHLYGNLIYYSTSIYDAVVKDVHYCRPEPYYFWVYFVGMNGFWLVIPAYCLWSSMKANAVAFREVERKGNSQVKKMA